MKLVEMTVADFSSEVDSNSPAPGGGSVAALASNVGVGLSRMMAHLSFGKKKYEVLDENIRLEFVERFNKLGDLRHELVELIDEDTESFKEFMKAIKMPKDTDEEVEDRKRAIEDATIFSIDVPFKTAKLSLEALEIVDYIIKHGNQNAITDIGVGILMIYAGMEGAILNVKVNLIGLSNKELYNTYSESCEKMLEKGKNIKDSLINDIHNKLEN